MLAVRLRDTLLDRLLKVGACGVILRVEAALLDPLPKALNQIKIGRVSRQV
jgi:hypothetical protein